MNFAFCFLSIASQLVGGTQQPFKIYASSNVVKIVPAGGWHVNQEYPWKIVLSDSTTRQFVLQWNSASVKGLVKGPATIRGGMCNVNTCISFSTSVVIP